MRLPLMILVAVLAVSAPVGGAASRGGSVERDVPYAKGATSTN